LFEQAMSLLLSGEFVCPVRYPDAYSYLSEEEHRRDADAYLARIGRKLARTDLGGAWYMAYERIGQEEKQAVRNEFSRIKQDIRFIVDFFVKAMRATGQEAFYSRADKIEVHTLMAAIDNNPGMRAEFQSLAALGRGTASDGKLKSILDRHLRLLTNEGYLVVANAEREIYQVTGKIEYLNEVVQFLMSADHITEDVLEPESDNLDLF